MPKIKSVKALYNSQAWIKSSRAFLLKHPLCRFHQQRNLIVAAEVVDHIQAHRGDSKLFWDKTNWQPLCKHCHDSHKQRLEKSGRIVGCDADGIPIDPGHHWAAIKSPGEGGVKSFLPPPQKTAAPALLSSPGIREGGYTNKP